MALIAPAAPAAAPAVFGWQPQWPESQRLAESLRSCRLTLLCGEAGSGKSSLLDEGLMPLLQRRAVDTALRTPRGKSAVVMPFPERRSAARASLAEIVIFFDAGDAAPLARLHDRIDAALLAAGVSPESHRASLPDRVLALSARWGTTFLFVFDRFDELLRTQRSVDGQQQIVDELVALLNRRLPANLLVAMRSEAYNLLDAFESRLQGVDLEMMVLPTQHGAFEPPPRSGLTEAAPPSAAASAAAQLRWHEDSQLPVLGDTVVIPPPNPRADRPFRSANDVPALPRKRPEWLWRAPLFLAPLVLVGIALPLVWRDEPEAPPAFVGADTRPAAPSSATVPAATPAATPAAAPATLPAPLPAPLPAAGPTIELRVENDGASEPRLPTELARALAADAGLRLNVRTGPGGVQNLPAGAGPARLALVRYDSLQAAAIAASRPSLAVVAPLYTEEIHVVVRADSALQFIHQIEGRRINVGSVDSGRALTADTLYRRMFSAPLPATANAALSAPEALQQLVAGDTLDAVVLVAPKPAASLAGLPPETRNALKFLRLAPDHPASRRALQAYLPATLPATAPGNGTTPAPTPTLAAMAFLVTTGTQDAATSEAIARFTRSLCDSLPALQRSGDAKWREVRPGLELPTAWPTAGAAAAAWGDCARPAPASTTSPPLAQPAGPSTTVNPGVRP